MANTTWYGDGTATVAIGSRTVMGTDTGWLTAVAGLTPIKAGDKFGIHVGRPIVIEQIVSDTELLLADDWPGPAQTDAPYKVELTSPTIAAVEAMRRLLASLSNGNLDSLAEITVGTDDIPIGIGPGVFGTISKAALGGVVGPSSSTDGYLAAFNGTTGKLLKQQILSAFAATILDDASGAAMFATMGATFSGDASSWIITFPNGVKIQGGTSSGTVGTGNAAISFLWPTTFSSICYAAFCLPGGQVTSSMCGVEAFDIYGASGYARHLSATVTMSFKWIGFGV